MGRSYTRMLTKQNLEIEEKKFKEVKQYLNQKVTGNFEVVALADILKIYRRVTGKEYLLQKYNNT